MNFGTPTTLDVLLDAVVAKLTTTDDVFPAERVIVTLADDDIFDDDPPADQFLTLSPDNFEQNEAMIAGGGNSAFGLDGRIAINLWSRFEVDWVHADAQALRNASYGILANWKAVLASLQQFSPVDGSGNGLVIEPMRVIGWKVAPRRANSPWLVVRSTWELKFIQDLTLEG